MTKRQWLKPQPNNGGDSRLTVIRAWIREARLIEGGTEANDLTHADWRIATVALADVVHARSCWAVAATMLLDWLLREEGA